MKGYFESVIKVAKIVMTGSNGRAKVVGSQGDEAIRCERSGGVYCGPQIGDKFGCARQKLKRGVLFIGIVRTHLGSSLSRRIV